MPAISTASATTRSRWRARAKWWRCDGGKPLSRRGEPGCRGREAVAPADVRRPGRGGGGARLTVRAGRAGGRRCAEAARDCGAVRPSVEGAAGSDHAGADRRGGGGERVGKDYASFEAGARANFAGPMTLFGEAAAAMCGIATKLLGWRPDDFWNSTPIELG